MDTIASFTIDHNRLLPGIYVSRKDTIGGVTLTTIDIRMTRPNFEPVLNTAELHAIEHIGATYLRNHATYMDIILYFGPMGCRTGFYLIIAGDYASGDLLPLIKDMYTFIADFDDTIPGASASECGNYLDLNLPMAKHIAKLYVSTVLDDISEDRLNYPE